MFDMFRKLFEPDASNSEEPYGSIEGKVRVKVVGVGGAGGNAVTRMVDAGLRGVEFLAVNTDVQALRRVKDVPTFGIGPETTGGMGSGGNPDLGRRAMRESHDQIDQLLEGSDMVFVTAGMGGGTGTGSAPLVADIARRQGALTVAVVTRPFAFEGHSRTTIADRGLKQLRQKVDTLITIENDRLLSSLDGEISLDQGFRLADEVLRQGVQGISEIITLPGVINVDFADVRTIMTNRGSSFMALGEGNGKTAAEDAVRSALANPLFTGPVEGAKGILFNVRGGKDLTIGQVHQVARIIEDASKTQAQVIFGVVQDPQWRGRVRVTLVATGIPDTPAPALPDDPGSHTHQGASTMAVSPPGHLPTGISYQNGHEHSAIPNSRPMT